MTQSKSKPSIPARVALASASSREEAVARAIDLVHDDLLEKIGRRVLVKPNFLSSTHRLSSTRVDAVKPVIAFLKQTGAADVFIAEGGSRSTAQALDNFGYRALLVSELIRAVDLNHVPHPLRFEVMTAAGGVQQADYADIRSMADTVISVPVAKTHDSAMVTMSVKNMMGCLRRVHRPRMHGIVIGDTVARMAEWLWNGIEGHPFVIKSFSGVVFTVMNRIRSRNTHDSGVPQAGLVRQMGAMAENLARMAAVLMPDIAIIDLFEAMEGNGPGSAGLPVNIGCAIAGTDPVTCDALAAYIMGFDPMTVGHIRLMHERGLGNADLSAVRIVGEDPDYCLRKCTPHRNYPYQLRWREGLNPV